MKRLSLILILVASCLLACVHEDSGTNTTAYAGGSTNPVWPSDSTRTSAIGAGTGPSGPAKNTDTVPKGFTLPALVDTSQKKKF